MPSNGSTSDGAELAARKTWLAPCHATWSYVSGAIGHGSEIDGTGERHEHPRRQVEPVELVELGEGVADRVIGVGARRLYDASDVRVVDALAEVDAPPGQLARVCDGEGVVRENA